MFLLPVTGHLGTFIIIIAIIIIIIIIIIIYIILYKELSVETN